MSRNTVLRRAVHFIGTDLDLKGLACAADERGMERLVHIWLRHGDIVFKAARYRLIHLMDHAQSRIAVLHRFYHDAHGKKIINLIQGLILLDHLFVDTEKVLYPSAYRSLDTGLIHMLLYLIHNGPDKGLSGILAQIHLLYQIVIHIRMEEL